MTALVLPRGMGMAERTEEMKSDRRTVDFMLLRGRRV
jgi:hypothetical protein